MKRGLDGIDYLALFLMGLTLVFIRSKLSGDIDWPWLGVFSPLILPGILAIALVLDDHSTHS